MTDNQASNQETKLKPGSYKAWFDPTLLVIAHIVLVPLWLFLWTLIPILIWLGDRGPVFYKQRRAGKDGRVITIRKFRTMVADAERSGPVWTTKDDPRVTTIGKVLRRTALDELPELISILKGDMSFVGPRALGAEEQKELEKEIPGFDGRLQVLPGLTGLAQIYDRNDNAQHKLQYDLEYIQRMNAWLDAKLLLLSVVNTIKGRWDQRAGKSSHLGDSASPPSESPLPGTSTRNPSSDQAHSNIEAARARHAKPSSRR